MRAILSTAQSERDDIARSQVEGFSVSWWREGNSEVDFVVSDKQSVLAIEVKSGPVKSTGGLTDFVLRYPNARTLVVGSRGCGIEDFLAGKTGLLLV